MCQTVYDTVHTVVYDTVHTVSFDTVRTFDTVKVMLDSVFTIDLLNKSQEFYSSSFNNLLVVVTILIALFVLAMTFAWSRKFKTEVEKLRNKMDDEVKHISEKAYSESKKVFEQNVSDLSNRLKSMSSKTDSLWSNFVKLYVFQASQAKDDNDCLRSCLFAFKAINSNFNPSLLHESGLLATMLEARFLDFDQSDLNTNLCNRLIEQIEIFESYFFEHFIDKSPKEKEKATDFINRINAIKACLGQKKPDK